MAYIRLSQEAHSPGLTEDSRGGVGTSEALRGATRGGRGGPLLNDKPGWRGGGATGRETESVKHSTTVSCFETREAD